MGIMLLLTLMLCLQVVVNPGQADVRHDKRALGEARQLAEKLRTDLAALDAAVSQNRELLDSGALVDRDILSSNRDQAERDNDRMAMDLKDLDTRTTKAEEANQKLQEAAANDPALARTRAASSEAADATRVLKRIQGGKLITYSRPKGSQPCWLVEVSSQTGIRAGQIGVKNRPRTMTSYGECLQWIVGQRSSSDFLIVVKPKAWDVKRAWEKSLQQAGVTYAFDVIPQDKDALDDVVGAGY